MQRSLPSLTGLRWIAACLVFAFHVDVVGYFSGGTQAVVAGCFRAGSTGVSLFFILSGFVLMWSHQPGTAARTFWWRRIARVWPSHLVAVVLAVVVGATLVPGIRTAQGSALLANVFLVSVWRPDWWQAGNPVSWSLACEAGFYLLFPLLAGLLALVARGPWAVARRPALPAVVALLGVYAVPESIELLAGPGAAAHHPLARLPEFALGIATAGAMRSGRWRGPWLPVAVALAAAGYLVADVAPHSSLSTAGWTAPGFALLIAALARRDVEDRTTWLGGPRLVRLGEWSFAFYLVHLLVTACLAAPWPDNRPGLPAVPAAVLTAVTFGVAVTLAGLLHTVVERPARRWLLRPAATRGSSATVRRSRS